MPVATIFGDGKIKEKSPVYIDAMKTGEIFAENGWDLATGAYTGIMEAALKGASGYNVKRYGVSLNEYHNPVNKYVNEEIATKHYLERLTKLIELGDVYIAFTGATGTLLEIVAVLALKQRNLLNGHKPLFCVNGNWRKLSELFDNKDIVDNNITFCESGIIAAEEIIKLNRK